MYGLRYGRNTIVACISTVVAVILIKTFMEEKYQSGMSPLCNHLRIFIFYINNSIIRRRGYGDEECI